eukprot:3282946-Pyramimonas_sp.AAC.1
MARRSGSEQASPWSIARGPAQRFAQVLRGGPREGLRDHRRAGAAEGLGGRAGGMQDHRLHRAGARPEPRVRRLPLEP